MLTSQMSALGSSFWLRIKAHQQGLESGQQRFPLDWGHGCHLVTTARGFPRRRSELNRQVEAE